MDFRDFYDKLNSLKQEINTYSLIDADHPLNIYIGFNDQLLLSFMIISEHVININNVPQTRSIKVNSALRNDGKNVLSFSCKDASNKDIFCRLCFDMLESARNAAPSEKYTRLIQRYYAWYRMLEGVRPTELSVNQQKGLCGELLFLDKLIDKKGDRLAVESWMGPCGTDQDFIMEDVWVEVKSISFSAESVQISSLEQLSTKTPGFLSVYKMEQTNGLDPQRFSVFSLANDIIKRIEIHPELEIEFREKIFFAGCDLNEDIYKTTFFALKGESLYAVQDDFPRLTKDTIPSGILSANYCIDLKTISSFKKETF